MDQKGDCRRRTGEYQKGAATGADEKDRHTTELEKQPEITPSNTSTKYEQTRAYAYAYLASQFLIAVVAAGGIWVAVRSLQSLNRSVTAANKQAVSAATQALTAQREYELSERPWVYADVMLAKPLTYDVNGASITVRFILRNVGHSPAASTLINMAAYPQGAPSRASDPILEQKKLCDPMRLYPPDPHAGGFTLFPNQTPPTEDMTVTISRKEISDTQVAEIKRWRLAKPLNFLAPIIVGCIDYRFEFSPNTHHQTGFIFNLLATRPETPNARYALKTYKDYSLDSLSLDPMMVIYGWGQCRLGPGHAMNQFGKAAFHHT